MEKYRGRTDLVGVTEALTKQFAQSWWAFKDMSPDFRSVEDCIQCAKTMGFSMDVFIIGVENALEKEQQKEKDDVPYKCTYISTYCRDPKREEDSDLDSDSDSDPTSDSDPISYSDQDQDSK